VTPRPIAPAAPCHCGQPIPPGRVAYCSPRCRFEDDFPEYDREDAA
jgi:predicted nucleic acid-binding Zn ribbon protein